MCEGHLQSMISLLRVNQALAWWMKKCADSTLYLVSVIKADCAHCPKKIFLEFDFRVALKPPKKAGDRPIRQVTQKVRSSTLRRCYLRSFRLYENGGSRARIESYWTKFLQWADSGTREGTIWMYTGERRWSEFINVIVPRFTSG